MTFYFDLGNFTFEESVIENKIAFVGGRDGNFSVE